MRTLVYCTAFARSPGEWTTRYRLWLRAVRRPALAATTVLLVDDGSETLPGWPGLEIYSGTGAGDIARLPGGPGNRLFHFTKRLGRTEIYDFPGWYRSFAFGALYGEAHGFDRVIHLESDAHLISARAHAWFRDYPEGWAALWSARYNFPEIAFQVAVGSGIRRLAEFARQPYDALRHKMHETALPFTHVERGLVGERYGEDHDQVPQDADYAAQVQSLREAAYYWWLEGRAPAAEAALVDWQFGHDGGLTAPVLDGWAPPEAGHRWMIGLDSALLLPKLPAGRDFTLLMTVMPHLREQLTRQRLLLYANDSRIGDCEVIATSYLGFRLPGAALRRDGSDRLRLLHPDARPPAAFGEVADRRWLSLALIRARIFPA